MFSYFANILAPPEEKEYFTELFRLLDKDGDGVLTAEEFEEAMQKFDFNGDDDTEKKNTKDITKLIVKKRQNMELHEFINSAIVFNML